MKGSYGIKNYMGGAGKGYGGGGRICQNKVVVLIRNLLLAPPILEPTSSQLNKITELSCLFFSHCTHHHYLHDCHSYYTITNVQEEEHRENTIVRRRREKEILF